MLSDIRAAPQLSVGLTNHPSPGARIMSEQSKSDARRRNRRKLIPFGVFLFFGLMASFSAIGNPRLAALHRSDVLQLIAIGMCFGAALATLVVLFLSTRAS
jgi:hypothetical protein